MFRIVEGNKFHIQSLKKIWHICFGDNISYIDFFFCECFPYAKSIVLTSDDIPVGAMYLMDVTADEYGVQKKGYYVYAVAILPDFRGKGLFKMMHDSLAQYLDAHNMFSILCPANEKLCNYYASLGYVENSFVSELKITKCNTDIDYRVQELPESQFRARRNTCFGENSVLWNSPFTRYILLENSFCGGFNLVLESDLESYFVVGRKADDVLYVTESDVPEENRAEVADFLCRREGVTESIWTVPLQNRHEGVLRGMTYNLKKEGYYFNHILN